MTDPDSDPLTVVEAARLLGMSPRTLARWADGGRVGHLVTPGGHRRFRRADVEALLAIVGPAGDRRTPRPPDDAGDADPKAT